jgi:pSer/pThr/pTyr-binding forkhead associated (FHA) protein
LGRNEKADVPLRDFWASHTHCYLSEMNGALLVRDLDSTNGIFLRGHRVTEATLLPGDRFTIGRTEITVHYQRGAQTAAESRTVAAESGTQPSNRETSPSPAPKTRNLLYGVAEDTAKSRTPPGNGAAMPMTAIDAFGAGYDAHWDGVDLEDNPYDQTTHADEFESWVKGWRQAALKRDYDESERRG